MATSTWNDGLRQIAMRLWSCDWKGVSRTPGYWLFWLLALIALLALPPSLLEEATVSAGPASRGVRKQQGQERG